MQIGLIVGAGSVTLGGDGTLTVTQPDGARVLDIPAGEVWRATAVDGGIALATGAGVAAGTVAEARVVPADSTAPVRVNGRLYRGTLALLRDRTGLTVVNQVGLDAYLLGVISGEMGRRDPGDQRGAARAGRRVAYLRAAQPRSLAHRRLRPPAHGGRPGVRRRRRGNARGA